MSDSTEIAKTSQMNPLANNRFEPEDFKELNKLCQWIIESSLTPYGVDKSADVMIIAMKGASLGMGIMQSLDNIHVIKGKPTLSADAQIALARQHPDCLYFKIIEWTDERCTYETHRRGNDPLQFTYTVNDAKKAKLWTKKASLWPKYTKQMLRARAGATLARAEYGEIMAGIYTPEEARSIDAGHVTVVADADTPSTDDLNEMLSEPADDAEVVDAEFEETEEAPAPDDDGVDVATQNRRIGQMIRHTDDLDSDDAEWVREALAANTTHGDFEQMSGKEIKLLVDTLGRKSGDAVDGELSERLQTLQAWMEQADDDEGDGQEVFV